MNRAQKNAWFGFVNCIIAVVFFIELFLGRLFHVPVAGFRSTVQPSQIEILLKTMIAYWPLALPIIAIILLLLPRRKQSPSEPDFDELDAVIQNKAIRMSYISVWILWPLAQVFTAIKFGMYKGVLPIYYLYVHLGVFLFCMGIYFLTKIILYRKQTAGMTDE